MDNTTKLKELQTRVKQLAINRDKLIKDAGAEENKLEQAYERLRELGISEPENLSREQLNELAEKCELELAAKIQLIEQQLEEGEGLMTSYLESK